MAPGFSSPAVMSLPRLPSASLLVVVLLPGVGAAYEARVVEVNSGHQLVVVAEQRRVTVRLDGIEAPTGRARYAIASRQSLIAVCGGEAAQVERTGGRERHGEQRASVVCNGRIAAVEQVRRGMAMLEGSAVHPPALLEAEAEARAAKRGVWAPLADSRAGR
jgi:endonuclease YncB( thermonuclease family)